MRKGVLLSLLASDLRVWSVLFPQLVYLCNSDLTYLMSTSQMSSQAYAYSDQSEAWMSRWQPMRGQQSLGPWLAITRHSCRYCSHPRDSHQGWDNKVTLFRLKPETLLLCCCCLLRKCETGQAALNGLCEFISHPRLMSSGE